MGFKYQFRDQQLIDDTLVQIKDFKEKYKNSPYMPLVDTMNSRLYMAKANLDQEIANLYARRDKPLGTEFYEAKAKESWEDSSEIEPATAPFYRAIFE
jgi:outer membrane protein assembly factor BamD